MKTKTTREKGRGRSRREQNRVYKAPKHKEKEQGLVLTGKPRPASCRAKEDDKPCKSYRGQRDRVINIYRGLLQGPPLSLEGPPLDFLGPPVC
jgi:hypothetical protein